jgi:CRP-like cAMP-binding protein
MAIIFDDSAVAERRAIRAAVIRKALLLMERISEFPAFSELTELDQMTLTSVCHEVHLEEGEELVRLGDEATSLFLVKSGRVQIMSPDTGEDQRQQVEIAHAGQVFGEVSALLDLPHNLDIVAQTDTELLAIPRESMVHLREHNPNLALSLYEIFAAFMGRRLRRLTVRMFSPMHY